jgi:trigger factor
MKITKKELKNSEIEFSIVIDTETFESYRKRAVAEVQKNVEVEGFRKGNAPEDIIVKKFGDMIILEEMANFALRDAYVKAVDEHKIMPISQPQVSITKIAKGNPLELTITVPVMPEVKLPAYKKIAKEATKKKETVEVTDKDIEDVIEELRKGRAHAHEHDHAHDGHDHEGHDHAHDHKHEDAKIPELNDEFAQSFGPDFKTVDDLKKKVGENLKLEKEQKAREKRRAEVMEAILKEVEVELPQVMVEGELDNMLAQMKTDITRFGGTWEDYLTHSKKTEDDIKKDWRKDAEKRAISQILLHKIAEAEKLTATEEEVEVELVRLLATVQDANEERAKAYLYQALTNEKVLKFLEEVE